jgi:hypothetical protein
MWRWAWLAACGAPDGVGATPLAPAPWNDEDFWESPGPLAELVHPADVSSAVWIVRMATSDDGYHWEPVTEIPLVELNSLDVLETPRGLVLVGVLSRAARFGPAGPNVAVFATTDLTRWSTHLWSLEDVRGANIVDPSLHRRPDGTHELVYYGNDVYDIDPVTLPGPHAIRRATWNGGAWAEDPVDLAAYEGAADPIVCNRGDEEWLFSTQSAERVVAGRLGAEHHLDDAPERAWEPYTVPSCRSRGDGLEILAQVDAALGPPRRAWFDGETLRDEGNLYDHMPWGFDSCSSPVMAQLDTRYVLFCAVGGAVHDGRLPGAEP